jgi:hypothetical protein
MTKKRKEECLTYRHQAILAEARFRARRKEKLLAKVQEALDSVTVVYPTNPSQGQSQQVQHTFEILKNLVFAVFFQKKISEIKDLKSAPIFCIVIFPEWAERNENLLRLQYNVFGSPCLH